MTVTPQQRSPSEDDWQPASDGEVVRLTRRLRSRRDRRRLLQAGARIVGGLFVLAGGWWVTRWATLPREYHHGGLTCTEVAQRVPAFRAGTLPPAEVEQVRQHVKLCPICQTRFERMGLQLSAASPAACQRPKCA
jgi:hypothetical protein